MHTLNHMITHTMSGLNIYDISDAIERSCFPGTLDCCYYDELLNAYSCAP